VLAIVLAGGFGSRLQEAVSDVPKPMAPINSIPFLTYILNYLEGQKIDEIILSVGYKHSIIQNYYGSSFHEIPLRYVVEDTPLGTGGAIKKALNMTNDKEVLILNGDTFFPVELKKICRSYEANNGLVTIALKHMSDSGRYGSIEIDEFKNIVKFVEKQTSKNGYINGGIYILNTSIFLKFSTPEVFSFEDFLEEAFKLLGANGVVFNNYFIDIGIPEDYEKAQLELMDYV